MTILSPRLVAVEKNDDRECACPAAHAAVYPVKRRCVDCGVWFCEGCISIDGLRHCAGFAEGSSHEDVIDPLLLYGVEYVENHFTIAHRIERG